MGAAESGSERNRLSAIAKIKQDITWRGPTGSPMVQIVITRSQAEKLVAEFERLSSQVEMRGHPHHRRPPRRRSDRT